MYKKLIYEPLPQYNINEIRQILNTGTIEEIRILPLSVGEYVENWKEAQDICVKLSKHEDEEVRANAARGLGYIARTRRKLEKHIVKPILLKLLNECTGIAKEYVMDAISDVNIFMEWNLGEKAIKRYEINLKKNK
jgi:hypothetical protein